MKRILLDAYLCRNLGDDLMVLELCQARPGATFVAPDLSHGIGETLAGVPNLLESRSGGWFAEAWHSDSYIMCGGSMFIDKSGTSFGERLRFIKRWGRRLAVALIIRGRRGAVEVIGCNVGPIQSRWGVVFFGAFLRMATRVTVRDSPSEELVLRWTGQPPLKAPDMVLSYIARLPERLPCTERMRPIVGISVMQWPDLDASASVEQYLILLRCLRAQCPDAQVKLFGFQSLVVRDDNIASRISGQTDWSNVFDCSYRGDIDACIQEYSSCSHIVATRFHSGILALGLGIPMVQLVYSKKTSDFLREAGWEGSQWATGKDLMAEHSDDIVTSLWSALPVKFAPAEAGLHSDSVG